jgi:hypothetical protein
MPTRSVKGYKIHVRLVTLTDVGSGSVKKHFGALDIPEPVHVEVGHDSRGNISLEDRDLTKMFSSNSLQEARTEEANPEDTSGSKNAVQKRVR